MTKETRKKKDPKKVFFSQRLLAFIVDMFIVSLIISLFATPFIDQKEQEKLIKQSRTITEKFTKNKIEVMEYLDGYIDISYKIARKNGLVSLIGVVIYILYFVVFQLYNNGQTLGKKLLGIRIKSETGELSMNQMIFRAFISNFILVEIISFIFMLSNSDYVYFFGTLTFESIQYLLVLISVLMILFRKDGCAVHDKLVRTKVVKI